MRTPPPPLEAEGGEGGLRARAGGGPAEGPGGPAGAIGAMGGDRSPAVFGGDLGSSLFSILYSIHLFKPSTLFHLFLRIFDPFSFFHSIQFPGMVHAFSFHFPCMVHPCSSYMFHQLPFSTFPFIFPRVTSERHSFRLHRIAGGGAIPLGGPAIPVQYLHSLSMFDSPLLVLKGTYYWKEKFSLFPGVKKANGSIAARSG